MMDKRNSYHTKQKEQVAQLITQKTREFSVKDLFDELSNTGAGIGLTTVYRAVDKLYKDGHLCKNVGEGGTIYYRYLRQCDNSGHCYLECRVCGKMTHIDCRLVRELGQHLALVHHFIADHKNVIIHGLCEKCSLKERTLPKNQ